MRRFPIALILPFIAMISGPGCSGEADTEGEGVSLPPQEELRQVGQEVVRTYTCYPAPSGHYLVSFQTCRNWAGEGYFKCNYAKFPPAVGGTVKTLSPNVPAASLNACLSANYLPMGLGLANNSCKFEYGAQMPITCNF